MSEYILSFADFGHARGCWSARLEGFQPATRSASCHFRNQGSAPATSDALTRHLSCRFKDRGSAPSLLGPLPHEQLHHVGLTNTFLTSGSPPAPQVLPGPLSQDTRHLTEHYLHPESCLQGYTPPTPPSPAVPPSSTYVSSVTGPVTNVLSPTSSCLQGSSPTPHTR